MVMRMRVYTKHDYYNCDYIEPVFENSRLVAFDLDTEKDGFIIRVYSDQLDHIEMEKTDEE